MAPVPATTRSSTLASTTLPEVSRLMLKTWEQVYHITQQLSVRVLYPKALNSMLVEPKSCRIIMRKGILAKRGLHSS
uniref:Uncharacterized protein n=1 Tax=Zea mays TaxID=4577 RepID=C0PLR9_MAIZE|nr:unknown [Zea mays]